MPTTSRLPPTRRNALRQVAIFTDSASDLDPSRAAAEGISIVPLLVTFGSDTYKAGVEMSTVEFWERMTAPDAPFPKTAAASPGEYKEAYEAAFDAGAEAIVMVSVAGTLSGSIKSAQIARDMLPDREIHVVDSQGASMEQGILARMAVELADAGIPAAEIAERLEARTGDLRVYVALETLEYLKKGGRISGDPGGDRHPAVGQADHPGQGRRGRHGRQGADPLEGARAADRADHGAPDRAAGHPPHGQPRRRGVSRRGPRPHPRARRVGRHDRPGGRLGRAAPRARAASARRSCIAPDPCPSDIASRLRWHCRPVPFGRCRRGDLGYTRVTDEVARQPARSQDRPARPVESSGRRPEPAAVLRRPSHVRSAIP